MDNIRQLVLDDEKFMGSVARGLSSGKTYEQIAQEAGQETTMMTHIFLSAIRILTGKMPYEESKSSSRKQAYYKARKWRKYTQLTDDERNHLESIIRIHEDNEDSPVSSTGKNDTPKADDFLAPSGGHSQQVSTGGRSGVYVYSYPLYLNSHISPQDGRTLYKIGASAVSVNGRVRDQAAKTPVPEDIILLRIFECSDAIKEERKFHRILTAAGHHHDSNHGGVEWFLTRLEMIDAIADSLSLFNIVEEGK